jgi:hypothetical protein
VSDKPKKVLLIGLDPKVVDCAALPTHLDEPTLRAGLDKDVHKLRELGYQADWLLIDRGETAEAVASAKLQSDTFDCILVGAGIRTVPPLSLFIGCSCRSLVWSVVRGSRGNIVRSQRH